VQHNALKIDGECAKLNADVRRLLDDALAALAEIETPGGNKGGDTLPAA
jgi:hypothetical protein